MTGEVRRCMRKLTNGQTCGATEDLYPGRNLCRPCKKVINKEYRQRTREGRGRRSVWFEEAYQYVAWVQEQIKPWNKLTRENRYA